MTVWAAVAADDSTDLIVRREGTAGSIVQKR
jgi:hypothetical protein